MLTVMTPSGRTAEIEQVYGEQDDKRADIIYADNGEPVSDSDYELIMEEYSDIIEEEWYQNRVSEADMLLDRMKEEGY